MMRVLALLAAAMGLSACDGSFDISNPDDRLGAAECALLLLASEDFTALSAEEVQSLIDCGFNVILNDDARGGGGKL